VLLCFLSYWVLPLAGLSRQAASCPSEKRVRLSKPLYLLMHQPKAVHLSNAAGCPGSCTSRAEVITMATSHVAQFGCGSFSHC
jgi:hypothetical protein